MHPLLHDYRSQCNQCFVAVGGKIVGYRAYILQLYGTYSNEELSHVKVDDPDVEKPHHQNGHLNHHDKAGKDDHKPSCRPALSVQTGAAGHHRSRHTHRAESEHLQRTHTESRARCQRQPVSSGMVKLTAIAILRHTSTTPCQMRIMKSPGFGPRMLGARITPLLSMAAAIQTLRS